MSKLLPVLIALVGLGGGVGAGFIMRPEPAPEPEPVAAAECPPGAHAAAGETGGGALPPRLSVPDPTSEFVKLANQFVIPLMGDSRVESMLVLSLSLEVAPGTKDAIFNLEPRLRDGFLSVLFDQANAGAFDGNFVNSLALDNLRMALRETAHTTVGADLRDVLIVDLVKQDI